MLLRSKRFTKGSGITAVILKQKKEMGHRCNNWPVSLAKGTGKAGRMTGCPSPQSVVFGIMIHCRGRICYVILDVNLRHAMALLPSLGVGKGTCVHLYWIKLPQNIWTRAVQRDFEETMTPTHFVLEFFWGAWASA